MYKLLTPKKDQLFRRQVKQAFKQRQNPQTSKLTNRQTNEMQTKPFHSTNGNCVGKHRNICSNKNLQRGELQLVQGLYKVYREQAGNSLVKMCVCNF